MDLTSVTFSFITVLGADVYSVQVSADPTNPSSYQQVAQFTNPSRSAGQNVSQTVNIASRFAGRQLLAWRVGAKDSADPVPPVGGYVFSNIASFTPAQAATAALRAAGRSRLTQLGRPTENGRQSTIIHQGSKHR